MLRSVRFRDDRIGIAARPPSLAALDALTADLSFGDQGDAGARQQQPAIDRCRGQADVALAGQKRLPVGHGFRGDTISDQLIEQGFATAGGLGNEQCAPGEAGEKSRQRGQWLLAAWFGRVDTRCGAAEIDARVAGFLDFVYLDIDAVKVGELMLDVIGIEKQCRGRQDRSLDIMAALFVALCRGLEKATHRLACTGQQQKSRILWQVVEELRGFLEKQGHVVLDTCRSVAVRDIAVQRAVFRLRGERIAKLPAKQRDAVIVHRKLVRWQKLDRVNALIASLGIRIESAYRFDLVIEELDAKRCIAAHWKQIENRAAQREFAMFLDLRDMPISGID